MKLPVTKMGRYTLPLLIVLVLVVAITAGVTYRVLTEDEITPNDEFFEVSIGPDPKIDGDTWTLTVEGLVDNRTVLTLDEIQAMPSREVTATLKCVDGPSDTAVWRGVRLSLVLDLAGVQEGADEVVFYASDGYDSSLTLEEAYEDDVLLCYEMNGETLPPNQGYPLRVVVPDHWGYKWVKWVHTIEVVDYDHKGYWESRGWNDNAEIVPLAEWIPHAVLLSIAAFLGGLSAIGGFKLSKTSTYWKDLPSWFSRQTHVGVSWAYYLVLFPAFAYWVMTTYYKRGEVFYSIHGILGVLAVGLCTVGLVAGIVLERGDERARGVHLGGNWMGYLMLLGTIALGLFRI